MEKMNEIVLFETEDKTICLSVPIEQETVWLTQGQMTGLFETSKQNISLHINNCFKEGELNKNSVIKDFLTTASDGKSYEEFDTKRKQFEAQQADLYDLKEIEDWEKNIKLLS